MEQRNGTVKKKEQEQTGFSVLQTALLLNESILKNEGLKRDGRSWVINEVKKKARFDLREQGHLIVILKPSVYTCSLLPLVMEWSPVKSKT